MVSKTVDPIVAKVLTMAGNQAALARHLGIHRQAFDGWRRVPATHVIGVEEFLKKKITRSHMRPDIYPVEI